MFKGLQESDTLDDSIPRPAFGLGAAFEELEKVFRDGHRILLTLSVRTDWCGADACLAGQPDSPRKAKEMEQGVGGEVCAENKAFSICSGDEVLVPGECWAIMPTAAAVAGH
jgi:hypothetical protein